MLFVETVRCHTLKHFHSALCLCRDLSVFQSLLVCSNIKEDFLWLIFKVGLEGRFYLFVDEGLQVQTREERMPKYLNLTIVAADSLSRLLAE